MNKDNGFILYACPICEVLLFEIEEKYYTYIKCGLNDVGTYSSDADTEDNSFDEYMCPECNTGSKHPDEYGSILKPVHFQKKETAVKINELAGNLSFETEHPMYGIPLDEERLKGIILEDSIGGNQ